MVIIRRESPSDRVSIVAVHDAAFASPGAGPAPEARLVDELRADGDIVAGLSLVAEEQGEVVGHVVCSRGRVERRPMLGLGPLGVLPDRQGHGVGQALMHAVLAAADALGEPAVLLLGDPGYYGRFGFEPAGRCSIVPSVAEWVPHFQIRRLTAWDPDVIGVFRYAPAFDRL